MDSQKKKDDEMIHMPFLHENITIEIPLHILQSLKPGQLVFPDPELHPYLYVVRTETGSHLFFKILIILCNTDAMAALPNRRDTKVSLKFSRIKIC